MTQKKKQPKTNPVTPAQQSQNVTAATELTDTQLEQVVGGLNLNPVIVPVYEPANRPQQPSLPGNHPSHP
jgi:hypothetical protein